MDDIPINQPILQMQDISKSFFGVKVLDQVSIDLYPGEVIDLNFNSGRNGVNVVHP